MRTLPPTLLELHKTLAAVQFDIADCKQKMDAALASGKEADGGLKCKLDWHRHREANLQREIAEAEQPSA